MAECPMGIKTMSQLVGIASTDAATLLVGSGMQVLDLYFGGGLQNIEL